MTWRTYTQDLGGLMTRTRTNKVNKALNHLVATLFETWPSLEEKKLKMVYNVFDKIFKLIVTFYY